MPEKTPIEDDFCISCGSCVSFCPAFLSTLQEEFSPRAKNHLFEALAETHSTLDPKLVKKLTQHCLSCGRCSTSCVKKLAVADRLGALRSRYPGWEQYLWDLWMTRGDILWPVLGTLGRALGSTPRKDMLAGLQALAPSPAIRPWIQVQQFDTSAQGTPALFFPGCTMQRVRPHWAEKTRAVLTGLGYICAEQTMACCGKTLLGAGLKKSALKAMKTNVEQWRRAGRPLVVTACASCRYGLMQYSAWAELFQSEQEREQWTQAVCNLASLWKDTTFVLLEKPASLQWHTPCHSHLGPSGNAGNVYLADHRWLNSITDNAFACTDAPVCCGLGGVTQLTSPGLSQRVAENCWQALSPEPGTHVVTGCSGCVLQLTRTRPADVLVMHWLDCLVMP